MLKKFRVLYLIYLIVITAIGFVSADEDKPMNKIAIYYVDKQMMRLVPVESYISETNPEKCAECVVGELMTERDYNSNIRPVLPGDKKAVSVKVKNNIAFIDLRSKYFENVPKGRIQEELIIYQLVNSISSIPGIDRIKFLIDGECRKSFFGFVDMREAFIPDYELES